jgi:hypothetical protein
MVMETGLGRTNIQSCRDRERERDVSVYLRTQFCCSGSLNVCCPYISQRDSSSSVIWPKSQQNEFQFGDLTRVT